MRTQSDVCQKVLADIRTHLGQLIAESTDEFTSKLSVESNKFFVTVRHPDEIEELNIDVIDGIAIYLADRGSSAWSGSTPILTCALTGTVKEPEIKASYVNPARLAGHYRFVLKAIDGNLGHVLKQAAVAHLAQMRQEAASFEEVWGSPH